MRNRWYDPETGRFVNEDPAGFAGGINLYAFAGNDPVNGSDPSGLSPESCYWVPADNTHSGGIGILIIYGNGYWECFPTADSGDGYSSDPSAFPRRGGRRGLRKGTQPTPKPTARTPGQCFGENTSWIRGNNARVAAVAGAAVTFVPVIGGFLARQQGYAWLTASARDFALMSALKNPAASLIEGAVANDIAGSRYVRLGGRWLRGGLAAAALSAVGVVTYLGSSYAICHLNPEY